MDTGFDISFYKNVYPKLQRFNNPVIMSHWTTQGMQKDMLGSEGQFYERYPDFDIEVYRKHNKGLKNVGLISKEALLGHFWHHGMAEERIYKDVEDNCNIDDIKNNYKVNHCYFSKEIKSLNKLITKKYNLSERIKPGMPLIMFDPLGEDLSVMTEHNAEVYLIFTKNHVDKEVLNKLKRPNVMMVFCITEESKKKLGSLRISNRKINLKLIDDTIFNPVKSLGDCIYVCNGVCKGNEKFYGSSIYESALSNFPQNRIIYSNTLKTDYNKMPDVYAKCFLALRLTDNTDTVNRSIEELKLMNIPVVHNASKYGLKWNNSDDVQSYINNYSTVIDNKSMGFDKEKLQKIRTNIETNLRNFNKYNNILLICDCDDHVNAKECKRLADILKSKCKCNVHIVYYYSGEKCHLKTDKHQTVIQENQLRRTLSGIKIKFDLVVIKNGIPVDLKNIYDCNIFYCVSTTDRCKSSDSNVLKHVKIADKTFCADNNFVCYFRDIGINVNLFYNNLLECIDKDPIIDNKLDEREYEYGVLMDGQCNINNFVRKLASYDKAIFLGLNADNYKSHKFKCSTEYNSKTVQRIKYVCIDHRNGMYDVDVVSALLNGCSIIHVSELQVPKLVEYVPIVEPTNKVPYIKKEITPKAKSFYEEVMHSKSICVLDTYNYDPDKIKRMEKIVEHFSKYNIKINYLLYTNRTLFLHNSISNVKYVDCASYNDLEFMYMKIIHENIDLLLINNKEVDKYDFVNKIKMSSRKVLDVENVNDKFDNIVMDSVKVFINFEAKDIAYGGGNVFVQNIVKHINKLDNVHVTFTLDNDIDVYFLVDIRRDGRFKKFTFDEIYANKVKNGKGKIVYRINDCDVTRTAKSLEPVIMKYVDKIDHFVFNSDFIKSYYFDKYDEFEGKRYSIIYNTSDGEYFYPKMNHVNRKLRIVTHHWSDNMNKGYEFYHKLHEYSKTHDDIELVFIGRKFNDNYVDKPTVHGPYKGLELANALRGCDIYITASIYDACPMHVLEGLSCGLPMLYIDHEGGGRNICTFTNSKVGEPFTNFDEILEGINKIKENYSSYRDNIIKNLKMYNSEDCYAKFTRVFIQEKI